MLMTVEIQPSLFPSELIERGIEAAQSHDGSQWTLGDLAIEADPTSKGSTLKAYAGLIGANYSTLKGYRRVAEAYGQVIRITSLSFKHHQIVAALPDRLDWLHQAADQDWSAAELRKRAIQPKPRATKVEPAGHLRKLIKAELAAGTDTATLASIIEVLWNDLQNGVL